MNWYDWLIVLIPLAFVMWIGAYSRRYVKDVTGFLSAGRVCGRYVISVGDVANMISVIAILAYIEVQYKTGFALSFWNSITAPLGILISLYGYCTYRFRETKAQSLGQFLEVRYSRKLRIFCAALRSISEIIANSIMPALAARFFIYFLDLPRTFHFLGIEFSTFHVVMVIVLTLAISIICFGGALAIIITDTIQGFICYPLMVLFVIFILVKFSWSEEMIPVLSCRAAGENFLNPYDIENLRDFNFFFLFVGVIGMFLHRASWIGSGGNSTAAKSPHEQKMAGILGCWRGGLNTIFYVLLAVALITLMNHRNFAGVAHEVRLSLSEHIAGDIIKVKAVQEKVVSDIRKMPVQTFTPGVDAPQSDKANVDTRYLKVVQDAISSRIPEQEKSNSLFQQFRTLYYQQMMPEAFRRMLPAGMLGAFCLLMVLAMVSTDDTRIFSATVTFSQDVILPFIKRPLTARQHTMILRVVAIAIGVIFFLGSSFMAQLDYINLFATLIITMWMGGCGPVMIFGLYSRFGTTIGAWVSILTGMFMAIAGILVQRNWADYVYPWLEQHDFVQTAGNIIAALSRPFEPLIVWRMDAIKCPINSYEWYFITMAVTFLLYCVISWLTCKEPYNLERMLHRGKYAIDGERNITTVWTWKNLYNKIVGITPEYTFCDRMVTWFYVIYSFGYSFLGCFVAVVIWNAIQPWPAEWWSHYFLVVFLIVPGIIAAITAVWFGICGVIDLRQMYRDLEVRVVNPLDDGRVDGHVSLSDKAAVDQIEAMSKEKVEKK